MAFNTTLRYNDNIIDTITDSKTICYDTKNKILKDNLIVDVKLDMWEGDIAQEITFYVEGAVSTVTFSCAKGMSWNNFVKSFYNNDTNNLMFVDDRGVHIYNADRTQYGDLDATPDDLIIEGKTYNTIW